MPYSVFCEEKVDEQGNPYLGYGIRWGTGRVEDISTTIGPVERLAALLNEGEAAPCHVLGIVEDFLAQMPACENAEGAVQFH